MKTQSIWRKILGLGVSIICLLYLWIAFDWTNIGTALGTIPWTKFLGLVTILILAIYGLRGTRWYLLAKAHAPRLSLLSAYVHNALGQALSEITPAQSGEAVKVVLTKQSSSCPLAPIMGAFSLERLYDLIVFAIILLSSFIMGGIPDFIDISLPKFSVLISVGVITVFGLLWGFRNTQFIGDIFQGFKPQSFAAIWMPLLLTFLSWAVVLYIWHYTILVADISLNLSTLTWVLGLSMFAGILSFAPSGLGASDAAVATLLTLSGAPMDAALMAMVLLRLVSVVIIGLGLCHLPFIQRVKPAQ